MTITEQACIVKDRMTKLEKERQELRKKYCENIEFDSRHGYCKRIYCSEGRTQVTTIHSMLLSERDEIEYKIHLCALEAAALRDELRRLYTNGES